MLDVPAVHSPRGRDQGFTPPSRPNAPTQQCRPLPSLLQRLWETDDWERQAQPKGRCCCWSHCSWQATFYAEGRASPQNHRMHGVWSSTVRVLRAEADSRPAQRARPSARRLPLRVWRPTSTSRPSTLCHCRCRAWYHLQLDRICQLLFGQHLPPELLLHLRQPDGTGWRKPLGWAVSKSSSSVPTLCKGWSSTTHQRSQTRWLTAAICCNCQEEEVLNTLMDACTENPELLLWWCFCVFYFLFPDSSLFLWKQTESTCVRCCPLPRWWCV